MKRPTVRKVLFLSRLYPPSVGGMQRFAHDLAVSLESRVRVDKLTFSGSLWWQPFVIPWLAIRAIGRATTHHYDIVHMQDATVAWVGWVIRRLTGTPYVVVAHGLDVTYKVWIYQKTTPYFLRRADRIICNSDATRDEVIARGVDAERCQVISIGVNGVEGDIVYSKAEIADELGLLITPKTKILLTVGRLVKRKGLEWFIDKVMPELVRQHPDIVLISAGKGPERLAIELALTRNRLRGNVKIAGQVSDEMRDSLYRHADVFIMPNIKVEGDMEGFGIVAIEAAASGLPVVASDIEGISDALSNGKNGYLVPSSNSAAFIEQINLLISDDVERRRFSERAKRFTIETYGWERVAAKFVAVYESVLSDAAVTAKAP